MSETDDNILYSIALMLASDTSKLFCKPVDFILIASKKLDFTLKDGMKSCAIKLLMFD